MPLFTKSSYPNGTDGLDQGLSPIEAMFYADKDGKKLADKPTEFLTMSRRSTTPTRSASVPTWSADATR